MGTRLVTDAARLSYRGGVSGYSNASGATQRTGASGLSKEPISGNYKLQVVYDGTAGKEGLPPELGPNELWLDSSGLYRVGLNFGPTLHNIGDCVCVISGCSAPRDYATKVTTARVAELSTKWAVLGTLNPSQAMDLDARIYSLLRFVFTVDGTKFGCVNALTM